MANYPIDRAALLPLLPAGTGLDTRKGDAYVSLVWFQFREVRVRGLRIAYHTRFPEVNLRFYVRHKGPAFADSGNENRSRSFWRKDPP